MCFELDTKGSCILPCPFAERPESGLGLTSPCSDSGICAIRLADVAEYGKLKVSGDGSSWLAH